VRNRDHLTVMDLDELLDRVGSGQPGSPFEHRLRVAIEVRFAQLQRKAAADALKWTRVQSIATAVSTGIAVGALLVAVL
jgi:hypothetical protein